MNNLIHHNNRGHLRAANVPCSISCYVNFKRHFFIQSDSNFTANCRKLSGKNRMIFLRKSGYYFDEVRDFFGKMSAKSQYVLKISLQIRNDCPTAQSGKIFADSAEKRTISDVWNRRACDCTSACLHVE